MPGYICRSSKGEKSIRLVIKFLQKNKTFSDDEIAIMEYALVSIRNDITKLLMMGFLAYICGVWHEFLFFTTSMTAVRIFLGGMHSNTFWGCFFQSLFWTSVGVLLSIVTGSYWMISGTAAVLSLGIVVALGPVSSDKRKQLSIKERKKLKRVVIIIEACIIAASLLFIRKPVYTSCLCYGVLIDNLQRMVMMVKSLSQKS